MANLPISIIFHGNDIDGWMAAYIITIIKDQYTSVKHFPVNPNKLESWPIPAAIHNTITYIVSATPQDEMLLQNYNEHAAAVFHFDHHPTASHILSRRPRTFFNTSMCSAALVYNYFYPHYPFPAWIGLVDRLTRWQSPTREDKALREILHPIACLPVKNHTDLAKDKTTSFLQSYSAPDTLDSLVRQGLDLLSMKDGMLTSALRRGEISALGQDEIESWGLPGSWLGRKVFLLNNTGFVIDSTLASAKIFEENPDVDIFVNYRVFETVNPNTGLPGMEYVFNARARNGAGIDLTESGVFAGHSCSAGAHYFSDQERQVPFVV